jgi:DeoR/GlpR family transcriptional regulator of sugar metabolism
MRYKKILARRLDILEFIMKRGSISPYELVERFDYSPKSLPSLLNRIKRAGL